MFSVYLGYIIELDEQSEMAQIETGKSNIRITKDVFDFRQKIDFYEDNIPNDELLKWEKMKQQGLLAFSNTMQGLYNNIKSLHSIKQGVRYKRNGKIFIVLGNQPNEIAKLQSFIWENADGKKTLDEIFIMADKQGILHASNSIRDFVESVAGLVRVGILFLKY